jgi:hypothetical protein
VEKLAVLRAWAEVYVVAQRKAAANQRHRSSSIVALAGSSLTRRRQASESTSSTTESLLSLVKPELSILSHQWSVALKDYAFLCLPSEYSSQLPLEGGAFYHADLVDSSKPVYKEHFTKILLAYCVWLDEIQFDIKRSDDGCDDDDSQKEKLFFMLLGLSLETLSNTTGLAQLSDETIENILDAVDHLLRTNVARDILLRKNVYLCVEVLSILYKYVNFVFY